METSGTEAFGFIRACISHRPRAERRKILQSFLEAGLNWEEVFREATRHGVRPLFDCDVQRLLGDELPSSLRNQIRERQQKNRIYAAFLTQELGKVYRLCEEHDLPILTLKGPVLAEVAYGDTTMRRYVDLDVLIPERRFPELDRLLKSSGYEYPEKRKRVTGWRRKMFRALKGQWQYTRAGGAFNLDVHTRIMPPGYSFPADFRPFWERSREVRLNGSIVVQGLAPEDQALMLSYHGVKNYWRSLKYVTDLAQLVRAEPSLDWSVLVKRAWEIRATRTLGLGLSLAHEVLGTSLPSEIQKWIRGKPKDEVRFMLTKYLKNRANRSLLSLDRRVRLQFSTRDTLVDQIRYGAYSAMQHLWSSVLEP